MALHLKEYKKRFSGDFHFYGNASHAFYDILVWLQENRPKSSPNVVLPIYIPAKLYRIVLAAGYEPRFYDVPLNCRIDTASVEKQIDDQTQAVFYIHYFGIPSPVHEIKYVTEREDLFLIEDCAHTLCSQWNGRELGSTGDCAIFSSRKMMQLPAGGFMVMNHQPWPFEPRFEKRVRSLYTACKGIQSRLKTLYFQLTRGYDPLNLAWFPGTGYINFAEEHRFTIQQISRLNEMYIHLVDLDKIIGRRRENFELILNGIKDISSLQLPGGLERNELILKTGNRYRLREGITPYSFPVLAPLGTREPLRKMLRSCGIGCGAGWPETPFGHAGFEQTSELSKRLLEFPVHHGMTRHQIERLVTCLQDYDMRTGRPVDFEGELNKRKKTEAKVV